MGIIKPWFPLILCCFLLASVVFFPHGTVSQREPEKRALAVAGHTPCRRLPGGVCRPGSPGAPRWRAKETSHTSGQVNSATPNTTLEHEKQRNPQV
ncbi:hypothetical protein V6N11_069154 [Hibiscus sabdariffa]|uniref:Uncharacterized protein n=2 Tax=Hibiscus sabdariffa TaxID=183260 RepID=A0ABR2AQ50_9ROSI